MNLFKRNVFRAWDEISCVGRYMVTGVTISMVNVAINTNVTTTIKTAHRMVGTLVIARLSNIFALIDGAAAIMRFMKFGT